MIQFDFVLMDFCVWKETEGLQVLGMVQNKLLKRYETKRDKHIRETCLLQIWDSQDNTCNVDSKSSRMKN